ncbi:unnamed protein product [Cyclocybe aegerita]|uniref:DUF6532 domain-containing protein n=1 Tax=Cyclocybe aegerita TaxID=1973307 RepID=A0A8S0X5M2_CYCAE|nr:unnamed protein product [Cyclocybe aegerita]
MSSQRSSAHQKAKAAITLSSQAQKKAAGDTASAGKQKDKPKSAPAQTSRAPSSSSSSKKASAEMAKYQAMSRAFEAQAVAAKEKEDENACKRNQAMIDAEEGNEDEDAAIPHKKKAKKKTSVKDTFLDPEEEALTSSLHLPTQVEPEPEPEPKQESRVDVDLSLSSPRASSPYSGIGTSVSSKWWHYEAIGCGVSQDPNAEWTESEHQAFQAHLNKLNNMIVKDITMEKAQDSAPPPQSQYPATPTKKSSGRILEGDFTPRSQTLAIAGKTYMRTHVVFGDIYPPPDAISCSTFNWEVVKEAVKNSKDEALKETLKCVAKDGKVKKDVMAFITYGQTAMLSTIISSTQSKVVSNYRLHGVKGEIKDHVRWLLVEANFMYGGIDIEKRTLDPTKPFGAPMIEEILKVLWFTPSTRSKLDVASTMRMAKDKTIPVSLILLVSTAIRHSISEYSEGNHTKASFSEDTSKTQYAKQPGTVWRRRQCYYSLICHFSQGSGISKGSTTSSKANLKNVNMSELAKMAEEDQDI